VAINGLQFNPCLFVSAGLLTAIPNFKNRKKGKMKKGGKKDNSLFLSFSLPFFLLRVLKEFFFLKKI
jgi:hypothetical protein